MANDGNLIHLSERPVQERKKIASMGGKASGVAKREKKKFREAVDNILSMPAEVLELRDLKQIEAIAGKEGVDVQDVIAVVMVKDIIRTRNPRLIEILLKLLGESVPDARIAIEHDNDMVMQFICAMKKNNND